jgi:hypothetical protein
MTSPPARPPALSPGRPPHSPGEAAWPWALPACRPGALCGGAQLRGHPLHRMYPGIRMLGSSERRPFPPFVLEYPMTRDPHRTASGSRGVLVALGAGVLGIVCCAGPVLLAAGVLGGLGAALAGPTGLVLLVGAVVVVGAALARRTRRGASCAVPPARPADSRQDSGHWHLS